MTLLTDRQTAGQRITGVDKDSSLFETERIGLSRNMRWELLKMKV